MELESFLPEPPFGLLEFDRLGGGALLPLLLKESGLAVPGFHILLMCGALLLG